MRASEQRYKALFEHTHSAVAIYRAVDDGDDFVFVDFNVTGEKSNGYTELSQDSAPDSDPIQKYLSEILISSRRARDLVRQILTFSRKSREERKPLLLAPIVRETLKLLRSTIPTTIEIHEHIDDPSVMVRSDPTQIHQLIMNLSTNAAHAMEQTGEKLEISLGTTHLAEAAAARSQALKPGPYVTLKISDTGSGIDSKILHRIFEPFFTTKEKGRGTGMGLPVALGIVKEHGGEITVESRPEEGSVFTVLLPRIDTALPAEELLQPSPGTGRQERILFIDDEEILMQLGEQVLESLGYTVTARSSSIEALELFQREPQSFDLIVTDQTMPHMTGYELAKKMIEIRPDIPVILCTGYSQTVSPEQAEAAGIKFFIYKPFSKDEIGKSIREALDSQKAT